MGSELGLGRYELRAEVALDGWALNLGALSQKPTFDETGWDRLIEFPQDDFVAPSDMAPPPLRCYFQVKSTRNKTRRVGLKLSAIRHLCDLAEPSFVLLMQFGCEVEPERVWLIPIDKVVMGRVLKRYRELSVDKAAKAPNQVKLHLTATDEHELSPPYHVSLHALILDHIDGSADEFRERKAQWRKTLGYEDGAGEFTVRTRHRSSDEAESALVDTALGLRTLDFTSSNQFDSRFGIRFPVEDFPSGPGWIAVTPKPVQHARVSLAVQGVEDSEVILSGELTVPAGLSRLVSSGQLPMDAVMKARIAIPTLEQAYLDVVLDFANESLQLLVREGYFTAHSRPLQEWAEFGKCLDVISSKKPVSIGVHGDGGTYGTGVAPSSPQEMDSLRMMGERIRGLTEYVGKLGQYVQLTASWRQVLWIGAELEKLKVLLERPNVVTFDFSPETPIGLGEGGIAAMCTVELGEFVVYRPLAAIGEVLEKPLVGADPSHRSLRARKAFLGVAAFRRANEFSSATQTRLLQDYAERVSESTGVKHWTILEGSLFGTCEDAP